MLVKDWIVTRGGTHTSNVSITGTSRFAGDNVPQIFQISLNGLNENGEIVRNSLGVVYTNDCGVEPIFNEGDEFGWLIIVSARIACATQHHTTVTVKCIYLLLIIP